MRLNVEIDDWRITWWQSMGIVTAPKWCNTSVDTFLLWATSVWVGASVGPLRSHVVVVCSVPVVVPLQAVAAVSWRLVWAAKPISIFTWSPTKGAGAARAG